MDYSHRFVAVLMFQVQSSVQFRRKVAPSAQIWPRPLELVRLFQCWLRLEYESRREEPSGRIRTYE
jgi:hypothetical protein